MNAARQGLWKAGWQSSRDNSVLCWCLLKLVMSSDKTQMGLLWDWDFWGFLSVKVKFQGGPGPRDTGCCGILYPMNRILFLFCRCVYSTEASQNILVHILVNSDTHFRPHTQTHRPEFSCPTGYTSLRILFGPVSLWDQCRVCTNCRKEVEKTSCSFCTEVCEPDIM